LLESRRKAEGKRGILIMEKRKVGEANERMRKRISKKRRVVKARKGRKES
jgi:hypothetical protein